MSLADQEFLSHRQAAKSCEYTLRLITRGLSAQSHNARLGNAIHAEIERWFSAGADPKHAMSPLNYIGSSANEGLYEPGGECAQAVAELVDGRFVDEHGVPWIVEVKTVR